jgi:hypothetical protein
MREGGGGVRQAEDPWGGAGDWVTGSDVIDSIPGILTSGNPIAGVPTLARIHYNLPCMKYQPFMFSIANCPRTGLITLLTGKMVN